MKLQNYIRFVVPFFLTMTVLMALTIYQIFSELSEQDHQKLNSWLREKKYLTLVTNQYNYERELLHIAENECNVRSLTGQKQCLDSLKFLDDRIKSDHQQIQDYNECDECELSIDSERSDGNSTRRVFHYHTFWQIDRNHSELAIHIRVLKLCMMSFLATQNLCCAKLLFWKLTEFPIEVETDLRQSFAVYIQRGVIEFNTFDLDVICKSSTSLFRNNSLCREQSQNASFTDNYLVALSDFVRFAVLDIYGGIYTDGDILFLKDTRILWDMNFAYRWSKWEYYNSGIVI